MSYSVVVKVVFVVLVLCHVLDETVSHLSKGEYYEIWEIQEKDSQKEVSPDVYENGG